MTDEAGLDNIALLGACKCCQLALEERLAASIDAAVSKALPVREMSSIARIELRAARHLHKTWRAKSIVSALGGARLAHLGASGNEIHSFVSAQMRQWAREVSTAHGRNLFNVYRLASRAAERRAKGKTDRNLLYSVRKADEFDHANKPALQALKNMEMYWVGSTFEKVSEAIQEALDEDAFSGMTRAERGRAIQKILTEKLGKIDLGSWKGSPKTYFEGLAANAVTNARVQGQIDTFSRLGVKTYEVVNPMDERTSEICQVMNGTVFEVSDAVDLLEQLRAADSPEEYKSLHPWLNASELTKLKAKGTEAMVEAGVLFPPYHFFCRSTIDVTGDTRLAEAA